MARLQWIFFLLLFLMVAVVTIVAYATRPALIATPRGVAIAALVVAYLGWDLRWRFSPLIRRAARWGLVAWAGNFALSLALFRLDPAYILLLWVLIGGSLFYLEMPFKPFGLAATAVALVFSGTFDLHWQTPRTLTDWGQLLLWALIGGTWLACLAMVNFLFATRARNALLIEELRSSQEQLRQAAIRERELATLREHERLARDLHDVVGHALVLVAVKLEAAQRLSRIDQRRAEAEMDATRGLVRETMNELRRVVASLRTAPSNGQSLAMAIAEQARETAEQAGLQARVHCEEVGALSGTQEEALRRVAQEAITNVVKHAGATELAVTLTRADGTVAVEVRDNGRGPAPVGGDGAAIGGHFGIRGMHEQMGLIGSHLAVVPAPGGGTRVRAELPVGEDDGDGGR